MFLFDFLNFLWVRHVRRHSTKFEPNFRTSPFLSFVWNFVTVKFFTKVQHHVSWRWLHKYIYLTDWIWSFSTKWFGYTVWRNLSDLYLYHIHIVGKASNWHIAPTVFLASAFNRLRHIDDSASLVGFGCLTTSPGFLPALYEKRRGFFYTHGVWLSHTWDRRLKVSSERPGKWG